MRVSAIATSALRYARGFARDRSGASAIEYSLLIGLIAMALLISFNQLGDAQSGSWGNTSDKAGKAMNP